MVSQKDIFDVSGPRHLSLIDWNCPQHRRGIAASLVQGAYVLERDRQQNREEHLALAPPWWEFFHFQLIRKLIDDADLSIFGAIYEYKPLNLAGSPSAGNAPKFVIAFRGTITKGESLSRDIQLDLHFLRQGLHKTSRFQIAMQAVQNMVAACGISDIWLTGHSLGSAVATLVGKNMAQRGILLESFLFNPPFLSAPIERIKDTNVRHGIRIANSIITAGISMAMKGSRQRSSEDSFSVLSAWFPNLFVNPSDHICSEYIGYFEHRQMMEDIGAGNIGRVATQTSVGNLLLNAFGGESNPIHLLPSATVVINKSLSPDFKWAHGIHQWLRPDLNLQCKKYQYR